jgi:hypothetical protein
MNFNWRDQFDPTFRTKIKDINMAYDIKEMVKGKKVKFVRYQNNELWYVTECNFEFPVPISDTGNAEFRPEDNAMMFMRWIRKHVAMLEKAKSENV